jgi:hypothetical protein
MMALSKIRSDSMDDVAIQSNKNLIINGDLQVWQRATSATAVTNAYATVDRFRFVEGTAGAYTSEKSSDSPIGSGSSLKLQVTTADTSMAAGDYAYFQQVIEAQNLQSLQYGTSSAKTLTLSFWVKSSKTGTYTIALIKADSTQYNFVHEYTISSANTWEKKTITISPTAGSTSFITSAAGAINNDNGVGFYVVWMLCSGTDLNGSTNNAWSSNGLHYTTTNQVNWMDNTSNNFYLSQVQLEIGDLASPFEFEDYGTTLAKCQRYFENVNWLGYVLSGNSYTTTQWVLAQVLWKVEKRTVPTLTFPTIGNSSGNVGITDSTANLVTQGSTIRSQTTTTGASLYNNNADGYSGLDDDTVCMLYSYGDTTLKVDAEL